MLFNIFMRHALTDDFWGLHKKNELRISFKYNLWALYFTKTIKGLNIFCTGLVAFKNFAP